MSVALDLFSPPRMVASGAATACSCCARPTRSGSCTEHGPRVPRLRPGHPGRVLAAQRAGDEWISISWGAAREQADAIAQALLDRGLGAGRPLMVLSGNSIEHVVLTLGAYTAGVPIVPGQHRLLAAVRRPRAHPRCRRAVPAGVVGYPPLCNMGDLQRREFQEALLDAASFEDLPGKWQAAILTAEQNRPKLRIVTSD